MEIKSGTFELLAVDARKSAAWYAELLAHEVEEPGDGSFEVEVAPNAYLMLTDAEAGVAAQGSVNVQVDDAGATRTELVDRGYACSDMESFEGMMSMFSVTDPDGRDITFLQIGG